MSNSSNSGCCIGLCDLIFIVLLILKLFGLISISWWWVFSPIIIGFVIGLIFLIILILISKKS